MQILVTGDIKEYERELRRLEELSHLVKRNIINEAKWDEERKEGRISIKFYEGNLTLETEEKK